MNVNALEALANPATHDAVVAELRYLAAVANGAGKRSVDCGDWKAATANFLLYAERERAAEALASGADFDPRDRRHVELAVASVRIAKDGGR